MPLHAPGGPVPFGVADLQTLVASQTFRLSVPPHVDAPHLLQLCNLQPLIFSFSAGSEDRDLQVPRIQLQLFLTGLPVARGRRPRSLDSFSVPATMTLFTSLRAIRGLSRSSLALTSRSNGGGCRWNAMNIMSAQRGLGSRSGCDGTGGVSPFARGASFQHTGPDRTMSTATATAAYDQLVDVFPSLIIGANGSIAPQGSFAEAQAQVSY